MMEHRLRDGIASIFSVLPERDASEAIRETLKTLRLGMNAAAPEVKWADFTVRGDYQRGGLTDTQSLSVRIVGSPADDPDILALTREARFSGVEAGRIVLSGCRERFFWFVPSMTTPFDRMPARRIKGIVVSGELFADVVEHFNPGRGVTVAEKRVMFQLVSGMSLRDASLIDRTSVETKRSQAKSACTKMQCSGQTDLVRTVLGQMFHLVSMAESEIAHADVAEAFFARHFRGDTALRAQRLSNGHLVNFLEAGPADGKPAIVLHGMMFGVLLAGIGSHLERHDIRLIMPIRSGYLQSFSVGSFDAEGALTDRTMSDLALFIRTVFGRPVPVIGQSLGAGLALRFAAQHPQLVSSLTLVSTNLTQTLPTDENFAGHLYTGLRDVGRQPGLCRLVTWQFRKYYADVELCRTILRGLFATCPTDLAVLDGRAGTGPVPPWFSELYQSSVSGIADDFHFTMKRLPHERPPSAIPVTLIHGDQDPITGIEEIRKLAHSSADARFLAIRGAGHFAVGSHGKEVWAAIARGLLPAGQSS